MHKDVEALRDALTAVRGQFQGLYQQLTDLAAKVKAREYLPEDLVDLGFLCREIEQFSAEQKKEAKAKKDLIGIVVCKHVIDVSLSEGLDEPTIRGQLASGTADIKELAPTPKPGSEEFRKLAAYLGITGEAVELGLMKFRFVPLTDWLTKRVENSKNLPPGIMQTYQQFRVIYRRKR